MHYLKIIKVIIIILLIPFSSLAQQRSFSTDYIPFRLIRPVDSVLTVFMDSLNNTALDGFFIVLYYGMCFDEELKYTIDLRYLPNIKSDTTNYIYFLVRNTTYFYLSNNKKFKIPLILGDDMEFMYEERKYPYEFKIDKSGGFGFIQDRKSVV